MVNVTTVTIELRGLRRTSQAFLLRRWSNLFIAKSRFKKNNFYLQKQILFSFLKRHLDREQADHLLAEMIALGYRSPVTDLSALLDGR